MVRTARPCRHAGRHGEPYPARSGARANQAETREKLVGMGVEISANTPDQFATFLRSEMARYAKVVKDGNLKAE